MIRFAMIRITYKDLPRGPTPKPRTTYRRDTGIAEYVCNLLHDDDYRAIKSIVVRPCTEAEYVKHTRRE